MDWWRRRPEMLRDAIGAIPVVLVFLVAQQLTGPGGSGWRAAAVVVVMGGALTVRRRWPRAAYAAALGVVAVATTGLELLAIVAYTLVAHDRRARAWLVGLLSAIAMVVGYLQYWPEVALDAIAGDLILIAALAVLPPVFGLMVRASRDRTAELERRNAELVALREEAARHAAEAERFRIARELHDVVAHHVSAMTVRARAGRHVAARDPAAAADALGYIAETGSATLDAMGALVGTLRRRDGDEDGRAPQPSLDDLPDLLEQFRRAGLVVHDELARPLPETSPALGLHAYRIVQEALTNAMRHGAAERAWVSVDADDGVLRIRVDDDGRGLAAGAAAAGHGLVGMAERAALHGGTAALGPGPRGGCRLEATLVLGEPRAGQPAVATPRATS